MIIEKYVEITVGSMNSKYWIEKGYDIPKIGGRGGKNGHHKIKVKVDDLPVSSNVRIKCKCQKCEVVFDNRYARIKPNKIFCSKCFRITKMLGNSLGSNKKGKPIPKLQGENNPRWNPNKTEFRKYSNQVRWLSEQNYTKYKHIINPDDYNRTLCGIDGGYQLDHIISIKEGFEKNILPSEIANINNLQLLPWKENRTKGITNSLRE